LNDEDPFTPKVTEAGPTKEGRMVGAQEPLDVSTYVIDM